VIGKILGGIGKRLGNHRNLWVVVGAGSVFTSLLMFSGPGPDTTGRAAQLHQPDSALHNSFGPLMASAGNPGGEDGPAMHLLTSSTGPDGTTGSDESSDQGLMYMPLFSRHYRVESYMAPPTGSAPHHGMLFAGGGGFPPFLPIIRGHHSGGGSSEGSGTPETLVAAAAPGAGASEGNLDEGQPPYDDAGYPSPDQPGNPGPTATRSQGHGSEPVPEPGSMLLFGAGLAVVATSIRKRQP